MRPRQFALLSIVWLVFGCGSSATGPSQDRIVEGVNFTQLFAPPTTTEINAVLTMWQSRDVSAKNVKEEASASRTVGPTQMNVRVVSHTIGGVKHFGAILTPAIAGPGTLPVLVYSHGGEQGENLDGTLSFLPPELLPLLNGFVVVVPSFRSENLVFDHTTYRSEGEPSPWDLDVDDALALLNVALATTPAADLTRIGVLGFSRGAAVGMLMAERDPRIDVVVEFFGPTDFFGPFVQQIAEEALKGQPRDLPGVNYLNDMYLQPLKAGRRTIAEVRSQLLRRSVVYFAQRLPALQVHHGMADSTVYVSEAQRLIQVMHDLGRGTPEFESYLYVGGTHSPLSLPGALGRAVDFLGQLRSPALAAELHVPEPIIAR